MTGESPIAWAAAALLFLVSAGVQIACAPPGLGNPLFPTVMAAFGASIGGAWELARRRSWDGVQLQAFKAGFLLGWVGIAIYVSSFFTGLY